MENKIWIRIVSNNYCLLKDKDELIEELRQVCVVQEKKVWHPAACTGFEFVSEILFNSTLSEFVQNIIVGGLAWDAIKKACAKILESLNNFAQKNNEFDFWNWKLCFDDVTIKISEKLSYAQIVNIYQKFPYHLENIKGKDISQIIQIELMYYESIKEESHKTEIKKVCEVSEDELLWKVRNSYGCGLCYYIPANETLIPIF